MKEEVPSECHMGKLLTHKKRGRPKTALSELETSNDHDEDDYDFNDDFDDDAHPFCPIWI